MFESNTCGSSTGLNAVPVCLSAQGCAFIWTQIIRFPVIAIHLVVIPVQVRVCVTANSSSDAEYVHLAPWHSALKPACNKSRNSSMLSASYGFSVQCLYSPQWSSKFLKILFFCLRVAINFQACSQNYEKRLSASSCRSVCLSLCLSGRIEQHSSHWTDFLMKSDISVFFENLL